MIVKTVKVFRDKKEGVTRVTNDTFAVSEERYKELRTTKLGALVEKVAEAPKTEKVKKPLAPKKYVTKK